MKSSLVRKFLILFLIVPTLGLAQGFVYLVGVKDQRPTSDFPNTNGYKISQDYNNENGHTGVDLANGSEGGEIRSIGPGTVDLKLGTANSAGFGNIVIIRHDLPRGTFYSLYAHMQEGSVVVELGQSVSTGQVIGAVDCTGSTEGESICPSNNGRGSHLHFAVKKSNILGCGYIKKGSCRTGEKFDDYVDPLQFIEDHTDFQSPKIEPDIGFDFAVDNFMVDGNIFGSGLPDGTSDFTDNFDDGLLTAPPTSSFFLPQGVAASNEANGFLNLRSNDGAFIQDEFVHDSAVLTPSLTDGFGNSVITASFRADAPAVGQFYCLGVESRTDPDADNVRIWVTGAEDGVVVRAADESDQDIAVFPIDPTAATGNRILLRLFIDDPTNRVTPAFSLDGGSTFTIFPPSSADIFTTDSEFLAFVQGAVRTPGFTDWMSSDDYQMEFDRQAENGFYPAIVEGRNQDGQSQFRAAFVPFPSDSFLFFSHHGVTREFYEQRNAELVNEGFTQVWVQTFIDASGIERFQATWVKE